MKDIQGEALKNYFYYDDNTPLKLHSTYGEAESMPVEVFFRTGVDVPKMELFALEFCKGRILDIGAGVGCHSLILQEMEKEVSAFEISPLSVEIMKERGVKNTMIGDVFNFNFKNEKFDTILMMMNGIGLGGSLKKLLFLFSVLKEILSDGGQIIFDSSDILYLYDEFAIPESKYYGEVSFRYEYKGKKGKWFDWVYVDATTLKRIANECDLEFQVIFEDYKNNQYVGRLFQK